MKRRQFFQNLVGGSVAAAFAPRVSFAVPLAAPVSFSTFLAQTSFYDGLAEASLMCGRAMGEALNEAVRQSVALEEAQAPLR